MITEVKQAIVDKLLELYPGIAIYDEDVQQKFITPSFLITLFEQDYAKRIGRKYRSVLSFDIAYFSDKPDTEIKADCYEAQLKVLRAFDCFGTFRAVDKTASITDNVLHVTFNVRYSEQLKEESDLVWTQTTTTDIR